MLSEGRRDSTGADERALLMTSTFMASCFNNLQTSQCRLFPAPSQTSRRKHPFPMIQCLFNWPPARPEHRWNMEQSQFWQDICGRTWCKWLQLTSEDHNKAKSPSPENQKINEKHFWKRFAFQERTMVKRKPKVAKLIAKVFIDGELHQTFGTSPPRKSPNADTNFSEAKNSSF